MVATVGRNKVLSSENSSTTSLTELLKSLTSYIEDQFDVTVQELTPEKYEELYSRGFEKLKARNGLDPIAQEELDRISKALDR